jgi:hypothetical protein
MNVRRLLRLADETHLPMRASAGKRGLYENLEGFREPRVSLRRVPRDEMLEGSGRANKAQRVTLMGRDAARMTTPCLASSARSLALLCAAMPGPCNSRSLLETTMKVISNIATFLALLCAASAMPGPCVALPCNTCVVYRCSLTRLSLFLSLSRKWVLEGARPFVAILLQPSRPPAP